MKTVLIYSRAVCPYCDMAKNLFTAKNIDYIEKNAEENMEEFMLLAEKFSHRTVPMIFIGDEFIGGFDNLKALQDAGTLDEKLK